jgi:hypothetical protein
VKFFYKKASALSEFGYAGLGALAGSGIVRLMTRKEKEKDRYEKQLEGASTGFALGLILHNILKRYKS